MGVPLNLIDIQSGFLSAVAFTANNTLTEEALAKTLSRVSNADDNAMEVDLDMGLNSIFNVQTDPTDSSSLLTVADADARYLNTVGDTLTGNLSAGGFSLTNLGTPLAPNSAARLSDVGPDSAAALRIELSSTSASEGASLVSMEGGPSVEDAVLDRVIRVTSVAAMEAYSAPAGYVFSLNAGGRSGTFDVVAGDFSTELAADTLNGVYVGLSDNPTATTKVLKRRFDGPTEITWFGAVGDFNGVTGTDNSPYLQAALLQSAHVSFGNSGKFKVSNPVGIKNGSTLYQAQTVIITASGATLVLDSTEAIFTSYETLLDPNEFVDKFASKVWFTYLTVEDPSGTSTMVNGDRLYNSRITDCSFDNVGQVVFSGIAKPVHPDGYMQSLYISNCEFTNVRRVVQAKRAFNFTFCYNSCEGCFSGVYIDGDGQPAINTARINGNIFEGGGLFLKLGGILGGEISGNYLESNGSEDVLDELCNMKLTQIGEGSFNSGLVISANEFQVLSWQKTNTGWVDIRLNVDLSKPVIGTPVLIGNWTNSYALVNTNSVTDGFGNNYGVNDLATKRAGVPLSPGSAGISYSRGVLNIQAATSLSGGTYTIAALNVNEIRSIITDNTQRGQTATLNVFMKHRTSSLVCVGASTAKFSLILQGDEGSGNVNDVELGVALESFVDTGNSFVFDTDFGSTFAKHFTNPTVVVSRVGDVFSIGLTGYLAVSVANYGPASSILASYTLENYATGLSGRFRGLLELVF